MLSILSVKDLQKRILMHLKITWSINIITNKSMFYNITQTGQVRMQNIYWIFTYAIFFFLEWHYISNPMKLELFKCKNSVKLALCKDKKTYVMNWNSSDKTYRTTEDGMGKSFVKTVIMIRMEVSKNIGLTTFNLSIAECINSDLCTWKQYRKCS